MASTDIVSERRGGAGVDPARLAQMFPEKTWRRLTDVPRLRGAAVFRGPSKAIAYAVPVCSDDIEDEEWRAGLVALGRIATIEKPQLLVELFPEEAAVKPLAALLEELNLGAADAVALYLPK